MAAVETVVNMSNDNSFTGAVEIVSGSGKLRMFVFQMPHRIHNGLAGMARIGASVIGPGLDWDCIDHKLHTIAILRGHRFSGLGFWRVLRGNAAECSVGFDEHRVGSKCLVRSERYLWCSREQFW